MAVPELVRFCMAQGESGIEPTLLIKSNSLRLKYLLQLKRFKLGIFRFPENWIGYFVRFQDDPENPASLWSFAQSEDELQALRELNDSSRCVVHIFNEIALNQASTAVEIQLEKPTAALLDGAELFPRDRELPAQIVAEYFESQPSGPLPIDVSVTSWRPVSNTYVTNAAELSSISIFSDDEGYQQEQIAVWLADTLDPKGVIRNPIVEEPSGRRELTDLLLSYEGGSFLFESKTLAILARKKLPIRSKLTVDLISGVIRAFSQLKGGMRNLERGYPVFDSKGIEIEVEREKAAHVIVLVPDLSLLSTFPGYNEMVVELMKKTKGFVHVLDPVELLRIVQAATKISSLAKQTTPMMAFDYYLIERAKYAMEHDSPDFAVLLRVVDSPDALDANDAVKPRTRFEDE